MPTSSDIDLIAPFQGSRNTPRRMGSGGSSVSFVPAIEEELSEELAHEESHLRERSLDADLEVGTPTYAVMMDWVGTGRVTGLR